MIINNYSATLSEAAYIAGIPDKEVRSIIEDAILPSELMNIKRDRGYFLATCVLASYYHLTSIYLYKKYRVKVIQHLFEKFPQLAQIDDAELFRLKSERDETWKVYIEETSIDFGIFAKPALERFDILQRIVFLEKIMDGEPTLIGTRLPARTLAILACSGHSYKEITGYFPSLPSYEFFQSAKIWSDLNIYMPPPKKIADIKADWKLISTTKVKFKKYEIFN